MSARYSRCRSAQLGDYWQARATQRSERARQRPSARRVGGRPASGVAGDIAAVHSIFSRACKGSPSSRVTDTVNKTGAIERHLRFIARGAIFAALCARCARALRTRHALRAQRAHCAIQ